MGERTSEVTQVRGWEIFNVRFGGYEKLPDYQYINSPEFACYGHRWLLQACPDMICIYHRSEERIKMLIRFCIRNCAGQEIEPRLHEVTFRPGSPFHCQRFNKLSDVGPGGALVVELRMKKIGGADLRDSSFIPDNPFCRLMLRNFMDEKSADVVFEVGAGRAGRAARKRARATPAIFHAHRLILQECAPFLAELCAGEEGLTPIPIVDVEPDVFRHLLYYVYGGKLADEDLTDNAKEIIDAADRYGVVYLKLEAEERYVRSTTITLDNVMENLLYAESKNCALLKEAAMDFIVENREEAAGSLSFEDAPGSLMKDLLTAVNMWMGREEDEAGGDGDLRNARVGTLRRMLHDRGLDIDGSREAMIALLKENY